MDRVVLIRNAPGEGVDVRHQTISKLVIADQDGPNFVECPNLILRPVPVSAENRTKYSILEPSRVEFLEFWIFNRIVVRRPIASDVRCPIRIAREREVQPGGHLMAQTPIRAIDVARPHRRSHSLLAEESGSRQEKDALLVRRRSPVLLDSERMSERKYIRVLGSIANRNLLVTENRVTPVWPVFLGLCAVEPERIPSLRKQFADQVVPVEIARLRIRRVVHARVRHIEVFGNEFLEILRFRIKHSPHRQHGVNMFIVQLLQFTRNIREI